MEDDDKNATVNIRIRRDKLKLVHKFSSEHPLKPSVRSVIELAIDRFMDLEAEDKNDN